jgi:hypothetical protein
MTGSTQAKGAMRHIPEDELHAYLDQGLSRSQCVEIESHLASCPSCQAERDSIAALRDRTTALLARLAPPRGFPPAFETLRRRAAAEVSARRRRLHVGAWAASLVAALGLGWTANYFLMTQPPVPAASTRPHPVPAVSTPAAIPAVTTPTARRSRESQPVVRRAAQRQAEEPAEISPVESLPPVAPAPVLEVTSVEMPRAEPELDGMWRTLSWDGAQAETGDKLPHIDGLPVVQIQLRAAEPGKQPLMVVAQQLSSGEVIRTIEGSMSDVSHLLAGRPGDSTHALVAADSNGTIPTRTDRTMAMQRGDRMLVIQGALPSDSLLAMIRRLNAEMRSK